jgi:hypothetical protein
LNLKDKKFADFKQKQFTIFDCLKSWFLHIFLFTSVLMGAQDRIYLMDGSCRVAKVLEIAPDYITVVSISESGAPFVNSNEQLPKKEVVLIEYKNGRIEIYNPPQKSLAYTPQGKRKPDSEKNEAGFLFNFASINSLALCNSDLSLFFEHLHASKKIGFGGMAAYNFNRYINYPNLWLGLLHSPKKNYDVGAFVNFYPGSLKRRTNFYMGILFKYMAFSYSKVTEEKNGNGTTIKYSPANGSQLATIVNIGTHSDLGNNFFFKTIAGIGGFNLRGDYKQQFNYFVNQNNGPGSDPVKINTLPKLYFGLNLGFAF